MSPPVFGVQTWNAQLWNRAVGHDAPSDHNAGVLKVPKSWVPPCCLVIFGESARMVDRGVLGARSQERCHAHHCLFFFSISAKSQARAELVAEI
jgi:hypothetical protein